MNTTELVVEKKAWKKFKSVRDLNQGPLRYRYSTTPTELKSQLGAGPYVDITKIMISLRKAKPECFHRVIFVDIH